ncbi:DUF1525 domain-containing protein [Salmonella enterica]|nr:DUF1525 domain-containing protein [Salmonella enterica]EDX2040234.1 DUF1525 domain-containing protein [Salmonella enterica subsp. houtenae serovar 50:z4,z23:-]HCZ1709248.1 DUF1525 domain-containing protein [Salmonella enterica subsp. enterica serovar Montevideo str. 0269]EAB1814372.1 DUF1525 domain-containing protein [Salmonella enterica]EAM8824200.1 DUF1525 domain-containing protein [Salmonella enterica]
MFRYLFLLALILSAPSLASTVVYTDRHHLPANVQSDTRVVYLDETEQLAESLFGPLSKNSVQAERQAQSKYPAVVFDDRDVVYGTADVALARTYLPGGTP